MTSRVADFVVVGAGSAGCIVAAELILREAGSVLLIEAGPTARHPLVSMPFGLVWLMGGARDWCFKSAPQAALGGRRIAIPRGRMVGGPGSINSMVWFRGRKSDFDAWDLPGWRWQDVEPAFEAVEAKLKPAQFVPGAGYFMDVTLCRPRSRGTIRLTENGLSVDPALLSDTRDLEDLVAGVTRLRRILADTDLGGDAAPERFPGPDVQGNEAIAAHIRAHCGTAYHMVGTLAMGTADEAPVSPDLAVNGMDNLWAADASVMPRITSANTNAPSMMIGHRAAALIAEAA